MKGIVARTPAGWWIDPLTGELFGGTLTGTARGETPAEGPEAIQFTIDVDRALISRLLAFVPGVSEGAEGVGTIHASGRLGEVVRLTIDLLVDRARVMNLPVSELRIPANLTYTPSGAVGVLQVRNWSMRLAGGQMEGNSQFRLGPNSSYEGNVQITQLDLEILTRVATDARHPASGKVSGRITYAGNDPTDLQQLRGNINLDLDDASLFRLPIFSQLEKFLGSQRGGVFEDGDLIATIANREIQVEALTLVGRIAQLHATGTVGFDTRLDLVVLVNTNQIISQTGQSLVRLIPGLSEVLGRRDEAVQRVGNYLSNRLLKFHITGTLSNPQVNVDPTAIVGKTAVGFFAGVFELPLGFLR